MMLRRSPKFAVVLAALLLSAPTWAIDLVWDGKTYLDIGLQLGADTLLVFPEPVEMSAEKHSAFAKAESTTDSRVLSIRPTIAQEQRVTFIGTKSKTIYLARFSTRSTYSPVYKIKDGTAIEAARIAATTKLTPTGLMKAMMAGQPVNGVSTRKQKQELVEGPDFKIASFEVWETPTMTGLVGSVWLQPGIAQATIRPSDVSLKIPMLGQVRMMGADRWDLTKDVSSTTVYFIFAR